MILPTLYHWSPASRYEGIRRDGLVAGSPPVTCSSAVQRISVSPDARTAWALSGAMEWTSEHGVWDLWAVTLTDRDGFSVRPGYGARIEEVQILGSVPAERVWYVGRRDLDGAPHCGGPG